MEQRVCMIISGHVQMVGFRFYAKDEAKRLGITGYVRNLPDGNVEIMAEGPLDAIHKFISSMRKGPPASRVDDVNITRTGPSDETFPSFNIRW